MQRTLKTEYFLWQLFNIEKNIERTKAELKVDDESLQELARAQDKLDAEIRERKKEQAVYSKDALMCEKKMAKKKGELDKKVRQSQHQLDGCQVLYERFDQLCLFNDYKLVFRNFV